MLRFSKLEMRLITKNLTCFGLFGFLCFTSCEDVIDVDVESIEPRLVVEADIEWEKGEDPSNQTIILSESTAFFDNSFTPINDAVVNVTKLDSNEEISFVSDGNGQYSTSNFIAEIGSPYQIEIISNGQQYIGEEVFIGVPEVNRIEQGTVLGFDGEDIITVDFFADDPFGIENFYFLTHAVNGDETPFLSVWDDTFQDGNELQFFYREFFDEDQETVVAGDHFDIEFMGVSEQFFDYMFLLTEQTYSGGDPFDTTPVQLRGNVANLTNPDEDAFGYFRLSEKVSFDYVVE